MKKNDVELIQRVLDGDEGAFTELVKKYQKPVHALVWRKIGDFHIAEEITQDTFLKVYQRLHSLKDPNQFSGWLYVIATRRCYAWFRKKRIRTQPLGETETPMIQRDLYSKHVVEDRAKTVVEEQRQVVKKLLAKLKESERTVMTLHYLGEMTVQEISKFLGVSTGTIKSRLQRARQRLQKEETMIKEALEHFQITPYLTENIMHDVSRLKPTPSKPFVPWVVAASSAILILLMIGIGSHQFLARFQKPYSLDAEAEMTVELVESPLMINLETNPDAPRQLSSKNALSNLDNSGQNPDEVLLANVQMDGDDLSIPKQRYFRSKSTAGTMVEGLLATSKGALYCLAHGHLYEMPHFGARWKEVSDISSITDTWIQHFPMEEWNNTLYILPSNKLYASKDDGKTWILVHEFPEEYTVPNELLLTEHAFYIIYENYGAFRSMDNGKTWKEINDEFPSKPRSILTVKNKLFAWDGAWIYRFEDNSWQRLLLPIPEAKACYSFTSTKDKLYVFALNPLFDPNEAEEGQRGWWIFRSTDLGNSWKNITPTHVWKARMGWLIDLKLIAAGETLLAIEQGIVRSTDAGDTWMPLQAQHLSPSMYSYSPAVVLNERILYVCSWDYGLKRSTDGGKSWDIVDINGTGGRIRNLIAMRNTNSRKGTSPTIYGSVGYMVKTTDMGKSWITIPTDSSTTSWSKENPPNITQIVKSDGVIYAKGHSDIISAGDYGEVRIYQLSTDGNKLVSVQNMPVFGDSFNMNELVHRKHGLSYKEFVKQLQQQASGATQFFIGLAQMNQSQQYNLRRYGLQGPFAMSGSTFYIEYNFKLFKWELGDTEWYDTSMEETVELSLHTARKSLKLAVSGDTVYVGKRDGHFLVSFDRGNNWVDVTPALPFPVKDFKEILVAGSVVYVATDAGIITSEDGRHWYTIPDTQGKNLIMERLTADGTTLYGVTRDTGFYRLESSTWKQIIPGTLSGLTSFAVDGNTLYVGTNRGMLFTTFSKK